MALDLNVAIHLLDDAVDRGETESRSLPSLLGRKERLENSFPCLRGHTGTRVAHAQRSAGPRVGSRMRCRVGPVERDVPGRQRQDPALGHGIARIHGQVHQDLLQLRDIGRDGIEVVGELGLDGDLLSQ